MDKDLARDLIAEIIERADEAKQNSENSDVDFGRKLAFVEVMSIFKRYLISESPDAPADYGIDFDAEERFI